MELNGSKASAVKSSCYIPVVIFITGTQELAFDLAHTFEMLVHNVSIPEPGCAAMLDVVCVGLWSYKAGYGNSIADTEGSVLLLQYGAFANGSMRLLSVVM